MTIYTLTTHYYDRRFKESGRDEVQFMGLQGLKSALESTHSFIKECNKHCYITRVSVRKTVIMGGSWARY